MFKTLTWLFLIVVVLPTPPAEAGLLARLFQRRRMRQNPMPYPQPGTGEETGGEDGIEGPEESQPTAPPSHLRGQPIDDFKNRGGAVRHSAPAGSGGAENARGNISPSGRPWAEPPAGASDTSGWGLPLFAGQAQQGATGNLGDRLRTFNGWTVPAPGPAQAPSWGTVGNEGAPSEQPVTPPPPTDPYGFTKWLNRERARRRLPPLKYSKSLSYWAALNNRAQRARGLGHFVGVGKFVQNSSGTASPGASAGMWMRSTAHFNNLMNPRIRYVGIDCSNGYCTFNGI